MGRPASASAISSAACGLNAPITPNGGSTGLVKGPSMLNTVRTPSVRRTGAMAFIAGWKVGANRKVKPLRVNERVAASPSGGSV